MSTVDELRSKYWQAVNADRLALTARAEAQAAAADFDISISRYLAEKNAPRGYHVDLFGDGDIKPTDRCTMDPKPGDTT